MHTSHAFAKVFGLKYKKPLKYFKKFKKLKKFKIAWAILAGQGLVAGALSPGSGGQGLVARLSWPGPAPGSSGHGLVARD